MRPSEIDRLAEEAARQARRLALSRGESEKSANVLGRRAYEAFIQEKQSEDRRG